MIEAMRGFLERQGSPEDSKKFPGHFPYLRGDDIGTSRFKVLGKEA